MGTLWSSIKQIEVAYLFDWENAIALNTVQGNRASSRGAGNVTGFSRVAEETWGMFSSYLGDVHSKLEFVQ